MSDRQVLFAIELASAAGFDDLLAELTAGVMQYLGYGHGDVAEVAAVVRTELDRRAAAGSTGACVLQFSVHNRQLLMSLAPTAGAAGLDWRASRPLP